MVECLKEAAASAVLCCGKHSATTCAALKKLADKCEEGGDFDQSIASYKKALAVGEVVYGVGDPRTKRIKRKLAQVVAEVKGENLDDGEEVEGSKFFHAEKLATQEFLAAEEDRLKKLEEQKVKRKKVGKGKVKRKKRKKKKKAEEEDLAGEEKKEEKTPLTVKKRKVRGRSSEVQ